jgi:hypothetical protein
MLNLLFKYCLKSPNPSKGRSGILQVCYFLRGVISTDINSFGDSMGTGFRIKTLSRVHHQNFFGVVFKFT